LVFHCVKENIGMKKKKKRNNQHVHIPETEKQISRTGFAFLKKKEVSIKKK